MSLVIVQGLALSYGSKVLFESSSFTIGPTDRIGLVGANGTGKSTLLKILVGQVTPDNGTLTFRRKSRVGYLPQDLQALPEGSLVDAVMSTVPGRDGLDERLVLTEQQLGATSDEHEQMELWRPRSPSCVWVGRTQEVRGLRLGREQQRERGGHGSAQRWLHDAHLARLAEPQGEREQQHARQREPLVALDARHARARAELALLQLVDALRDGRHVHRGRRRRRPPRRRLARAQPGPRGWAGSSPACLARPSRSR